ncbi:hypothetical protein [Bacillus thuringiensis]|uniref:hypothetical protein n=1 Tax=Bacillus thuringiensis TaxID=1428 RepID=UPI003A8A2D90
MASKTVLLSLNQGDILRVLIRLSAEPVFIGETSFVIKKVATPITKKSYWYMT